MPDDRSSVASQPAARKSRLSEPREPEVLKDGLADIAFARAKEEYSDLCQGWKLHETKANATAATAGVFLAAALAFSNHPRLENGVLFGATPWIGALLVAVLTSAIWYAMASTFVRSTWMPMCSEKLWTRVKPFLLEDVPHALRARIKRETMNEMIDDLVKVNVWLNQTNIDRATRLAHAQRLLGIGAGVAALLAWARFFA